MHTASFRQCILKAAVGTGWNERGEEDSKDLRGRKRENGEKGEAASVQY